jgi:hypothetical protein
MKQAVRNERVVFYASTSEPFEIYAQLQALMCFPDETSDGRDRVAKAICADILDQQSEMEPEIAPTLRDLFPQYLKSKNRVSLASHGKRWGEAFIAGAYFLVRVKKEAIGEHPLLNGVAGKVSGRAVVKAMFPEREDGLEIDYDSRLHDIEKHSIRRFYPIAHLAAAYQCAAHVVCPEAEAGNFEVHNLDFHKIVVQLAGAYAECIRATPELANVAEQLIELDWRD